MLNFLIGFLGLVGVSSVSAQSHVASESLRSNIAKKMPTQADIKRLKEKDAARKKEIAKDREKIGEDWDKLQKSLSYIRDERKKEYEKVANAHPLNPLNAKATFTGASSMTEYLDDVYQRRLDDYNKWAGSVYQDKDISEATKKELDDTFVSHLTSLIEDRKTSEAQADARTKVAIGHLKTIKDASVAGAALGGIALTKGKVPEALKKPVVGALAGAAAGSTYDAIKGHVDAWAYASEKAKDLSFNEKIAAYLERRGTRAMEDKGPSSALIGAAIGAGAGALPAGVLRARVLANPLAQKSAVGAGTGLGIMGAVKESSTAQDFNRRAGEFEKAGKFEEATEMRAEAKAAESRALLEGFIAVSGIAASSVAKAKSAGTLVSNLAKAKSARSTTSIPPPVPAAIPTAIQAKPLPPKPVNGRVIDESEAKTLAENLNKVNKTRNPNDAGTLFTVNGQTTIFARGSGGHPSNKAAYSPLNGSTVEASNSVNSVAPIEFLNGKKVKFSGVTGKGEIEGTVMAVNYDDYTVVLKGPLGVHFEVPFSNLDKVL